MAERFWAVKGKIPGGKSYRGIVTTRGSSSVVMSGPGLFTRKPWNKRALTLEELETYGTVEKVPRPRLTAPIERQLEHKFVRATDLMDTLHRGLFLQFVQDVREQAAREA
jgi:hypothetical protein